MIISPGMVGGKLGCWILWWLCIKNILDIAGHLNYFYPCSCKGAFRVAVVNRSQVTFSLLQIMACIIVIFLKESLVLLILLICIIFLFSPIGVNLYQQYKIYEICPSWFHTLNGENWIKFCAYLIFIRLCSFILAIKIGWYCQFMFYSIFCPKFLSIDAKETILN